MEKDRQQEYDFGDEDFGTDAGTSLLDIPASADRVLSKKRFSRRKLLVGAGIAGGALLVAGVAGDKLLGYLLHRNSSSSAANPSQFKLTGPLTTPKDIVVYTNGALAASWRDQSWADDDLSSLVQPYQNQPAARLSLDNWAAFSLHHTGGALDLTDFGYLQFYINGGSGSGQKAFALFTNAKGAHTHQTLITPYIQGGGIRSSAWRLTRIPLAAMKASKMSITGVLLQDASGATQPDVFIADLRLIYAPDLSPPRITQALALDLGTITLVFDKRMNQDDVQATRFYSISGQESAYSTPQAPLSAHYDTSSQSVSLITPTPMRAKNVYTVTIGAVHDTYGIALPDHSQVKVTAQALAITIDAAQNQHAISPFIYGVGDANAAWVAAGRPRVNRWGGNQTTRYNWKLGNAFNAGSDYYFSNGDYGHSSAADRAPSGMADEFIAASAAAGAASLITIPNIGWVARDVSSASVSVPDQGGPPVSPGADAIDGYDPTANRQRTSVPSRSSKNTPLTDPPDLSDPSVAQDEWVYHLTRRFGSVQNGGVRFYAMDNEPDLWAFTHTDVRPAELGYDQMRDIFLDYATAVKRVDPTALVTGPVLSGWTSYFYSALDRGDDNFHTHADKQAHGGQDFLPWWLAQIRAHDERTGQRSLDVLDIHYYPQGGEYSGNVSPQMSAQRLRAVRSLWDPTYTDVSWIHTQIQLIPRMKQWIQENYPGTKLGITEWNFGAEQDINGALAVAEVLGVFGREGLDLACYWAYPPLNSPSYFAWKLFTDYNGQGNGFGATSVQAVSSDYDLVSCYASLDSDTGDLLAIVLNKNPFAALTPAIQLANAPATQAQVYQMSGEAPQINQLQTVTVSGGTLQITLPASSITLLRFKH